MGKSGWSVLTPGPEVSKSRLLTGTYQLSAYHTNIFALNTAAGLHSLVTIVTTRREHKALHLHITLLWECRLCFHSTSGSSYLKISRPWPLIWFSWHCLNHLSQFCSSCYVHLNRRVNPAKMQVLIQKIRNGIWDASFCKSSHVIWHCWSGDLK